MAIAQITVVPIGTATSSISKYIARAFRVLEVQKDVVYQLTSMGTIIEGDLDKILEVVRLMHENSFDEGVQRVLTTVVLDDRRDRKATMDDKVSSVLSKLAD